MRGAVRARVEERARRGVCIDPLRAAGQWHGWGLVPPDEGGSWWGDAATAAPTQRGRAFPKGLYTGCMAGQGGNGSASSIDSVAFIDRQAGASAYATHQGRDGVGPPAELESRARGTDPLRAAGQWHGKWSVPPARLVDARQQVYGLNVVDWIRSSIQEKSKLFQIHGEFQRGALLPAVPPVL
jgi:hypothetical protein